MNNNTKKPINAALLSFGMSGTVFHAPFLQLLDEFHLFGVWERTKNLAQLKYPSIKTFRSLDELLADQEVELIIVNTPNSTHFEYTKKALEAGKHVIVEKPFAVSSTLSAELIKIAANKKRILSVYHNRRYDSDYRTVKRLIESGLLGEVVEAEFHFDRYKEELSAKIHKELPGEGTGALYDLGSHLIDQALHLFGFPDAVFADIRIVRQASQVDDYFEVLLYYRELRVRLHCSYLVREPLPAFIINGKKGTFLKSRADIQEAALQANQLPGTTDWGIEPETARGLLHAEKNGVLKEYVPTERGNYGDYYTAMYRAIRYEEPVPVSPKDALAVIRIIEAAFESQRQQKVISLHPL